MQLQCTVNHNLGFVIGSPFCIIKWDILLQTWITILSFIFISKHQVHIECSSSLTKGVSYLADLYLARFPFQLLFGIFPIHYFTCTSMSRLSPLGGITYDVRITGRGSSKSRRSKGGCINFILY